MCQQGIYSGHYLIGYAVFMWIILLKNGAVCETNETESLFNNPIHDYTKELIKLMPKIESII